MKTHNLIWLVVLLSAYTCSNKESFALKNATIRDTGEIAADGCGYVIDVDNSTFSPVNLEKERQVNGLNIQLSYIYGSDSLRCGWQSRGRL